MRALVNCLVLGSIGGLSLVNVYQAVTLASMLLR